MKNKLEQLLNSLIEKGWKPRGHKANRVQGKGNYVCIDFEGVREDAYLYELVRKSSGLWQFVCENGMIKTSGDVRGWCYHNEYDDYDECDGECDDELKRYYDDDFQYYLIESALCDEDKLEEFLLSNVKIDG